MTDKSVKQPNPSPADELIRQVPLNKSFVFLVLALPTLLSLAFGTWNDMAIPTYIVAGTIMLSPCVRVLYTEGWNGFFTATSLVSITAYFLYCNNTIVLGDSLVSMSSHTYPVISTSVRNSAALVNLGGCSLFALGLLLTYKPRKPHAPTSFLPYGQIFVSNRALRNSIFMVTLAFVGARVGLIISAGISPIDFILGSRSSGSHLEFAGKGIALAHLANVFQVTAIMGGALLLARKSKVRGAFMIAAFAIATPLFFAIMRGTRSYVLGYVFALCAFAIVIPLPRVRRIAKALIPVILVLCGLTFALQTIYRNIGLAAAVDPETVLSQEVDIQLGINALFAYEQSTTLELAMYLMPDRYQPLYGETLIALPVNFVPRVLWPEKPSSLGPILADRVGVENVTLSAGLIGEGWCNFLLPGALLLPFLFGLFAGAWDRLRNLARVWPDGYALWAAGLPGLFLTVRGDFLTGGVLFMYSAIGTTLILLSFARYRDRNNQRVVTVPGVKPTN